jgi:DNA-binding GntR family transcriptional regulator
VNAPAQSPRPSARLRRAQLSDEVAGHLRASIMTGVLRPGTFIRLDETAAQLGVSITPVREALLKLSGEGMVELEPHRGHVVVPLGRTDVEDIFWLQATIAKELAVSATGNATDADIDELAALNEALATAVAARRPDAIVTAEFAFHRALNRLAGRVKLAWFLLHAARYMPPMVYADDPDWGREAVDNHTKLIAALRARDVEAVVALTEWQFTDGVRRLTDMLEQSGIWADAPQTRD